MSEKNYLAMYLAGPEDRQDAGVKGMKWGIRKRDVPGKPATVGPAAKKSGGSETSSEKYDRLLKQAKDKGGNSLTDDDLRFVTARGNAIAQVERMHQQNPNWIADAAKQVLKNAAKKQMQNLLDGASKKYITDPLLSPGSK